MDRTNYFFARGVDWTARNFFVGGPFDLFSFNSAHLERWRITIAFAQMNRTTDLTLNYAARGRVPAAVKPRPKPRLEELSDAER